MRITADYELRNAIRLSGRPGGRSVSMYMYSTVHAVQGLDAEKIVKM